MKEVAPGAFLMDGKLATQQCSLTDSETGSASEKQDGNVTVPNCRLILFVQHFSAKN